MAKVNSKTRVAVFKRDKLRCRYCCKALLFPWETSNFFVTATIDHVVPKSKGGSNHISNLVTACGPCNSRKGDGRLLLDIEVRQWLRDIEENSRRAWEEARRIVREQKYAAAGLTPP